MNWDAIGAVGEILGALGVIVSLVYLAGQICGNTTALRRTASHEAVEGMNVWLGGLSRSTKLAAIMARGLEGLHHLSPEETAWFRVTFFQFIKVLEDLHFQYEEGILDAEQWEGWRWLAAQYLTSPAGREYWQMMSQAFSPRFRALYATLQPEASFKRLGGELGVQEPS